MAAQMMNHAPIEIDAKKPIAAATRDWRVLTKKYIAI